jgi:hypothetical protein
MDVIMGKESILVEYIMYIILEMLLRAFVFTLCIHTQVWFDT